MISDQELVSCVESLLQQGGPIAVSSINNVVRQLEAKLGVDLTQKASFIHDQIDILLGPRLPSPFLGTSSSGTLNFAQNSAPGYLLAHHFNHNQYLSPPVIMSYPALQRDSVQAPKERAPKRRGGPGGLSKACGVSPQLQAIVGEPTMARTEIVKQLWAYIRKNNLQDPNNKRIIVCNEELRLVFETDSTDMFKMNKLLAKHIMSLEPLKELGSDSKRVKRSNEDAGISVEAEGGQYPVVISHALAQLFELEEREMLQSEASKLVRDYIKAKHLEDPINNMILCDTKLEQLFGCKSLFSSEVPENLAHHLSKQS